MPIKGYACSQISSSRRSARRSLTFRSNRLPLVSHNRSADSVASLTSSAGSISPECKTQLTKWTVSGVPTYFSMFLFSRCLSGPPRRAEVARRLALCP